MAVHLFIVLGADFTEDRKKIKLQYLYYWLSIAFGFLAFGAFLGPDPEITGLFMWISKVMLSSEFASPVFVGVVMVWICLQQFGGYFSLRYCKTKNRWLGEIITMSFVPAFSLITVQDRACQEDYLRFIYFVSCGASALFSYLTIAIPDDVRVMELLVSIENEKLGNVQNPIRIAAQDDGPRNRGQQHGSPSGGGDDVSTCHDILEGQDPFSSDEDLLTIGKDDI